MKSVLVTGSKGQLGSELQEILKSKKISGCNFIFTDIEELDITDKNAVDLFVAEKEVKIILNCAAFTAVDLAETETAKATLVNSIAPANLADAAKNYNAKLIHISTDYVFDGTNCLPYKEEDETNPMSAYGLTKQGGELAIQNLLDDSIIIRTAWLYSSFGSNFVKTILKYGKERDELRIVCDQVGTPTYAFDLACVILKIIETICFDSFKVQPGIFHYSNEGVCSWYDFAKEIIEISNITCNITPIETKDYPLPAKRPSYSVLNKSKIKLNYNIEIPYWKDSLKLCISKLK